MAHLGFIGQAEQILEHLGARQRRHRERRDEFRPRLGQDGARVDASLRQAADQFQRFVGRDAATDNQKNTFAAHACEFQKKLRAWGREHSKPRTRSVVITNYLKRRDILAFPGLIPR